MLSQVVTLCSVCEMSGPPLQRDKNSLESGGLAINSWPVLAHGRCSFIDKPYSDLFLSRSEEDLCGVLKLRTVEFVCCVL